MIQEAADRLNNRVHSSTGYTPNDVNVDNASKVFGKLYPDLANNNQPKTGQKPTFRINDKVRILYPKINFEKGDTVRTSDEVYLIGRILFHPIVRYKLADIDTKEIVTGSYNEQELIPVS